MRRACTCTCAEHLHGVHVHGCTCEHVHVLSMYMCRDSVTIACRELSRACAEQDESGGGACISMRTPHIDVRYACAWPRVIC